MDCIRRAQARLGFATVAYEIVADEPADRYAKNEHSLRKA